MVSALSDDEKLALLERMEQGGKGALVAWSQYIFGSAPYEVIIPGCDQAAHDHMAAWCRETLGETFITGVGNAVRWNDHGCWMAKDTGRFCFAQERDAALFKLWWYR